MQASAKKKLILVELEHRVSHHFSKLRSFLRTNSIQYQQAWSFDDKPIRQLRQNTNLDKDCIYFIVVNNACRNLSIPRDLFACGSCVRIYCYPNQNKGGSKIASLKNIAQFSSQFQENYQITKILLKCVKKIPSEESMTYEEIAIIRPKHCPQKYQILLKAIQSNNKGNFKVISYLQSFSWQPKKDSRILLIVNIENLQAIQEQMKVLDHAQNNLEYAVVGYGEEIFQKSSPVAIYTHQPFEILSFLQAKGVDVQKIIHQYKIASLLRIGHISLYNFVKEEESDSEEAKAKRESSRHLQRKISQLGFLKSEAILDLIDNRQDKKDNQLQIQSNLNEIWEENSSVVGSNSLHTKSNFVLDKSSLCESEGHQMVCNSPESPQIKQNSQFYQTKTPSKLKILNLNDYEISFDSEGRKVFTEKPKHHQQKGLYTIDPLKLGTHSFETTSNSEQKKIEGHRRIYLQKDLFLLKQKIKKKGGKKYQVYFFNKLKELIVGNIRQQDIVVLNSFDDSFWGTISNSRCCYVCIGQIEEKISHNMEILPLTAFLQRL